MTDPPSSDITPVLIAITAVRSGWARPPSAGGLRELSSMAARELRSERAGHTLTPTALVHEAYLNHEFTT